MICEYCGGRGIVTLPATHRKLNDEGEFNAIEASDYINEFPCPACSPVLEKECVKDYRMITNFAPEMYIEADYKHDIMSAATRSCVAAIADKMYEDGMFEVKIMKDESKSGQLGMHVDMIVVEVGVINSESIVKIREERNAERMEFLKFAADILSKFYMRAHDMLVRIARLTMDDEKTLVSIEKEQRAAQKPETLEKIIELHEIEKAMKR